MRKLVWFFAGLSVLVAASANALTQEEQAKMTGSVILQSSQERQSKMTGSVILQSSQQRQAKMIAVAILVAPSLPPLIGSGPGAAGAILQ